jgi:hypothetical protein
MIVLIASLYSQFIDHPWFVRNDLTSPEAAQEGVLNWIRDIDATAAPSKRSKTVSGAKSSKKGAKDSDDEYGSDFDEYDA